MRVTLEALTVGSQSARESSSVSFQLEARLEQRPLAIDLVSTLVAHCPTSDRTFRHELVTAFGEAFNNIVIHSYKDREDGILDVEVVLEREAVTIKLKDSGHSVDLTKIDPPDLDSLPERGMGVFMMHTLCDEVVYQCGAPNVLSLTKRTTLTAPKEGDSRDELHSHG